MNNSSTNNEKLLEIYCERCKETNEVEKEYIFSGGDNSKYAVRCPNCGHIKLLPQESVEKVFGELKV